MRPLNDVQKNQIWWDWDRAGRYIESFLRENAIAEPQAVLLFTRGMYGMVAEKHGLTFDEALALYEQGRDAPWRTSEPPE